MHEELTGQSGAPSSPTAPALDTSPDNEMPPKSSTIADAFERRLQQERERVANDPENYSDFDDNHEKRQHFRRLIDPGIMRPNPRHIALKSLQVHCSHV